MERESDLLLPAARFNLRAIAAVVPQQPFLAVEDRVRFVTGRGIKLVFSRPDDRVSRMPLPVGNAILGTDNTDLRVLDIWQA